MLTKVAMLVVIASTLAGCGKSLRGSALETDLGIKTPEFAVAGKTRYDQNWIDDTTERLVSGADQPRPKPRPARLDAPVRKVSQPTAADQPISVPAQSRKPRWWQKWRKPKVQT